MSDHDNTPRRDAGRARRAIAACCLLASLAPVKATAQARDEPRIRLEEVAVAQDRFQRLEAGVGEWGFTLDFETGDLRGWEASGAAFRCQPTLGDNPRARDRENSNHQGRYWIGTFECYQGQGSEPGSTLGDRPQGTLTSRSFVADAGTLSFLVGGGAAYETRVELRRLDPIEGAIRVLYASGSNRETMQRVAWDLAPWAGSSVQLRVVDTSSGGWGHINVDDFRFAPTRVEPPQREDLVPVPELRRGSLPRAEELLASRRLELGRVELVPSAAEVGSILEQDPEADREVPFGSSVDVVVARGVEVPPLVGRDWIEARRRLEERGLAVGGVREGPSPEPTGVVLAQDPPPGVEVPLESPVGVEIAAGVAVPDLRRRLLPEAERILRSRGLRLGSVVAVLSSEAADSVIRQSPPAETEVPLETAVDVTVAEAIEPPGPPGPGPSRPDPPAPDPQLPGPQPPSPRGPGPFDSVRPEALLVGLLGLFVLLGGVLVRRAWRRRSEANSEAEATPSPRVVPHPDLGRQALELEGNELIAARIRLRGRKGTFESTLEVDGPLV